MNELVSVPISPWYTIPAAVGLLALTFVFAPGVLLHLGVLIYPKDHERRQEFTAELYKVPYIKRPFWVAGALVRCAFEGVPARLQSIGVRRTVRQQAKEIKNRLRWERRVIMGRLDIAIVYTKWPNGRRNLGIERPPRQRPVPHSLRTRRD